LTVKTLEKDYVFSVLPNDLQKLHFLILKVLMS